MDVCCDITPLTAQPSPKYACALDEMHCYNAAAVRAHFSQPVVGAEERERRTRGRGSEMREINCPFCMVS